MKVSTVYTNLHCKNLISNFNVNLALSHIVSEIYKKKTFINRFTNLFRHLALIDQVVEYFAVLGVLGDNVDESRGLQHLTGKRVK